MLPKLDLSILSSSPFRSFWMGGFECSDHQNAFGERVDLIKLTSHDTMLATDYANLLSLGIKTVREGIRWSDVEKTPYNYGWSGVQDIIDIAGASGMQVLWDICHFGYPDDLTPFHPMFPRRFAHVCQAFVKYYRSRVPDGPLIITPINEVSFISWLGGDACGTSPYCTGKGWEVKYRLMKAYIEGVEMMKEIDPGVIIMTTEPLVNIVPLDPSDSASVINASHKHHAQFQVLEMLTGHMCPELRGRPEYLDLIGLNFYYMNQWVAETNESLPWGDTPPHKSWRTLKSLVEETFIKYNRPLVITETSHPGEHRPQWLNMIGQQCADMLAAGLPLWGCCIYPAIDRPDWDHPETWHRSGIWDIYNTATLERVLHPESGHALQQLTAMFLAK